MGGGGDEVGDVAGVAAGRFNVDGEELRGMAGETFDGDARNDGFDLAGAGAEESHLAGGDEGVVVIGEVADGVAFELEMAMIYFSLMREVAGIGEGGDDAAVGGAGGVPSGVVEVKVGVDDDVDFFGIDAGGGEGAG